MMAGHGACRSAILGAAIAGLLLLLAWPAGGGGAELPATQPLARHEQTNVIMISLDILRPDHLGTYGYARGTSPRIDRLAQQSVLFENAIAQSYLTPVAQMSVFTGRYPRSHGMVSFEVSKDEISGRTLPEILRYYGYETAAVVSSPEFFMRYDTASGKIVNPKSVFSRDFATFNRTMPDGTGSVRVNPSAALDWLKANKDRKFFLWVETGMLHPPYGQTVPPPTRTQFDPPGYTPFYEQQPIRPARAKMDQGVPTEVLFHLYRGNYYLDFKPVHQLTDTDIRFITGRYDAGIAYTDAFIGELLQLLDTLGLSGKTLVILHSIHGEGLGEHGYFFHHDIFDSEVKTALMFRFPGNEQGGTRITRQVQGIDIMPTVLDYLQIPLNHESQGHSLLPLIQGNGARFTGGEDAYIDRLPWWEYVLGGWHLEHQSEREAQYTPLELARMEDYRRLLQQTLGNSAAPPQCIAIRTNEWKLILRERRKLLETVSWWNFISGQRFAVAGVELYDLARDPREQKNVANEYPAVVETLRAKLLAWDATNPCSKTATGTAKPTQLIPYP